MFIGVKAPLILLSLRSEVWRSKIFSFYSYFLSSFESPPRANVSRHGGRECLSQPLTAKAFFSTPEDFLFSPASPPEIPFSVPAEIENRLRASFLRRDSWRFFRIPLGAPVPPSPTRRRFRDLEHRVLHYLLSVGSSSFPRNKKKSPLPHTSR